MQSKAKQRQSQGSIMDTYVVALVSITLGGFLGHCRGCGCGLGCGFGFGFGLALVLAGFGFAWPCFSCGLISQQSKNKANGQLFWGLLAAKAKKKKTQGKRPMVDAGVAPNDGIAGALGATPMSTIGFLPCFLFSFAFAFAFAFAIAFA